MSNTDLSPETLAEWLSICEKATPGPWTPSPNYVDLISEIAYRHNWETDSEFIAAAREGWPRTIKELIAANEQNQRIRERLNWDESKVLSGQIRSYIELESNLAETRKRLEEAEAIKDVLREAERLNDHAPRCNESEATKMISGFDWRPASCDCWKGRAQKLLSAPAPLSQG